MSTTDAPTVTSPPAHTGAQPPGESRGRRLASFFSGGIPQIVLLLVGAFWLIPGIGLLVASLRSEKDDDSSGWWTAFAHPGQFTTHNYAALLKNSTMISAFTNTVIITITTTVLVVVIGSMAGYAFAWMEFPGRDWIFLVVVGLLAVPLQVALIPIAKFYNLLGLFHTLPAIILFHLGFGLPFAIFLLRNFFAGIPRDLLEAARMDGATEWRIFRRVILPLGLPAIASLGIFQFLWTWNDLLVGLTFGGPSARPLTVAIQEQFAAFGNNIDVISSASFLSMVVPLIVFFSFQRYFVQGVLAGSVK